MIDPLISSVEMKGIRRMALGDAARVAEIHKQAWDAAYAGILPDHILGGIHMETSIALWRDDIIPRGDSVHLVYEEGGIVWGFLDYGPCRDPDQDATRVQEIYAIYISPQRSRAGYGKALFQEMLRAHEGQAPAEITLWVLEENRPARRFYETMGFVLEAGSSQPLAEFREVTEVRYIRKSPEPQT